MGEKEKRGTSQSHDLKQTPPSYTSNSLIFKNWEELQF